MQFITISEQLRNIAFAAILGCIVGFGYDIIYLLKLLFAIYGVNQSVINFYKLLFTHICDFVYVISVSVSYCIFVYHFNSGRFRLYLLVTFGVGVLAYKCFLSSSVRSLLNRFAIFVRFIIKLLIIKPMYYIIKVFCTLFLPLVIALKFINNLLYTNKIKKKIIKQVLY